MVHTGQKVNNLNLNLYFISINKLRRAWFCARGGKLNIANACIYARASYFRRAPRAEIARPRMHAPAPTPLSLLPPPPPFPLPLPLPPLPFPLLPSYLPSPSLAIIVAVAAARCSLVAATAGSSLAASTSSSSLAASLAGAFPCARLLRRRPSVAVVAAVAAHLRPALSLGLNSRDALTPAPPALPSPLLPALVFPVTHTFCHIFTTAAVVVVVAAAAATSLVPVLFPELNSGDGANAPLASTLPSPLLSSALRLQAALLHNRCCCCCCCCSISATGVVLGVKSQGWLLARWPPPVFPSCAPTVAVAAAAVYPPHYFRNSIPGICRVYLFLHRDR